ncbi:MAG: type II CAAX endopeptidase family protein [Anaerolineales bacterium]
MKKLTHQIANLFKVFTPPVRVFLGVAFLPAWVLFLVPLFFEGGNGFLGRVIHLISWSLAMWAPGLGAIIATRRTEQRDLKSLGLGKLGKLPAYLWAWVVPVLMVGLTGVVTWLLGLGSWNEELTLLKEAIYVMDQTPEMTAQQIVGLQIFSALFIAPVINTLFALGEEVGWRGFLLPRLLPLGQTKAMIVTGVIWGVWHAPAIAQGFNYPQHPVRGIFMMIVFTTAFGMFLGWLYFKTRSPWAPAFAHGTLNAVAGLPLLFLTPLNPLWGGAITSLTGLAVVALLVAALYVNEELPVLR